MPVVVVAGQAGDGSLGFERLYHVVIIIGRLTTSVARISAVMDRLSRPRTSKVGNHLPLLPPSRTQLITAGPTS